MRTMLTAGLALIAAPALAAAQDAAVDKKITVEQAIAQANAAEEVANPEIKAILDNCAVRKFETTAAFVVNGKKRSSKVTLCGKPGQTDADWANTLKDAVSKVAANPTMAQTVKDQIIAALGVEIANIESANVLVVAPVVAPAPPPVSPPELAPLPPLPPASAVATIPRLAAPPPPPAPAKPRLTIGCSTPGEPGGGGPCIALERNTLLTIRADEDLAGGGGLRFLRRGEVRGEIALTPMRRGQSLRIKLPPSLCAGVASSRVELQIIGRGAGAAGQVAATLGPWPLRC